jgi:CRISPR/Cas system-associated exonuclease Cas4 (RecB family)
MTPKEALFRKLTELTNEKFDRRVTRTFIDFKESPSLAELRQVCLDGVLNYPRTMAKHRLLGDYAKSEVDLTGWIDQYNKVGGKADILIRRSDTGITIMDGKNSAHKKKYLNPDQLRWYALCFYRAFSEYPDRLGYIYWRFPYDKETGEDGVEWIEYTKDDLKRLAQLAVETKTKMFKQKFAPTPLVATCRFCDYASVCSSAAKPKAREDNFLENLGLESKSGVVEFGITKKS